MKAVVQRVIRASVTVDTKRVSAVGRGLVVLVGAAATDTREDAEWLSKKILALRLWPDDEGEKSWTKNVIQRDFELLCVSQFTLLADIKKPRPSFHRAMNPIDANIFYSDFVQLVRDSYKPDRVSDGEFGAMMEVELVNDGPVTLILDSKERS